MLIYNLNSDGVSYSAAGISDTSVTRVEVPDTYNGLPVTELSANFADCNNLKEIFVGNNVKEIGFGTLDCPSIERIYLGRGIEIINGPLENATNLSEFFYNGTEEEWEKIRWYFVENQETVIGNLNIHFGVFGKSVVLSYGEDKIFPYTHWDCVKGKPENIASEKVVYDNSISGLVSDNVKDALDELNAKHFDVTSLESWTDLLYLVRSGKASEFISVGDQFVSTKDGNELVWDVIGIDADTPSDEGKKHSLTLQLRDCYVNMPFSVPEASFFAVEALEPGQYYLKAKNYSSDPVYYGFTLSEVLSADGLIRISENMVYIYESRSTEYHTSFAVDTVSDNADDMEGTFLSQENYLIHTEMGTMNYKDSDVRKWLNSTEDSWWYHSHGRSLAPVDYVSIPGFGKGMDEDFLNAVNPVKKTTVLPDGSEITTEDKFFLLSAEEVYASGDNAYEYYKENSSYSEPSMSKDASRIKNFESSPRHWWLRNATTGDDGLFRVLTDGGVGVVRVAKVLAYGIAPACCIC